MLASFSSHPHVLSQITYLQEGGVYYLWFYLTAVSWRPGNVVRKLSWERLPLQCHIFSPVVAMITRTLRDWHYKNATQEYRYTCSRVYCTISTVTILSKNALLVSYALCLPRFRDEAWSRRQWCELALFDGSEEQETYLNIVARSRYGLPIKLNSMIIHTFTDIKLNTTENVMIHILHTIIPYPVRDRVRQLEFAG